MKIVVVTAITNDRDALKERQVREGAEFVAFCDRPVPSTTWEIRPACDLFRDPVRNAKIHKILPHLYFPDHDYSLWIDGSVELTEPAPRLVERYLAEHDLAFARHAVHATLADEVASCLREVRDDPAAIAEQVAHSARLDDAVGFPLGGVILRRHSNEVALFNLTWWAEICRWSRRDMLSLAPALQKSGARWHCFPRLPELERDPTRRTFASPHFRWYPHGSDLEMPSPAAVAAATALGAQSPWWTRRLEFLEAVAGSREAYALDLEHQLEARTRTTLEAERYARSLEAELQASRRAAAEAERYAKSLEAAFRESSCDGEG